MKHRIDKLRGQLDELGLDAALISNSYNRRYLSGFTGSAGWLLITRDDAVIATDFRYFEQSAAQAPAFRLHKAVGGFEKWMTELLRPLGPVKLAFEAADISYHTHRQLRKCVTSLPAGQRPQLVPTTDLVEMLRAIKEPEEIDALERAVLLGDAAFVDVARRIEPGWTEKQVAWEIEKYIREHGGDGLSFDTIVAAGPWGALPHAYPRDEAIREGEGIVIDMGVNLGGYMSDLTRTIVLGKPDDRFCEVYDIVLTAQLAAEELIIAGMTGEEAHQLAHRVISEAGHGDHFGHGLGHGVGLQIHESPRLGSSSKDVLRDGMVITIEPGIYIPGWGGVRIEDQAVIEKGRLRILTTAPKLEFVPG